jgi:hypothetical protein
MNAPFMCDICGLTPCASRSFCRVCREADRKHAAKLATPKQEPRPAPVSIVDALIYCIKARGVDALKEPGNFAWLAQCDEDAKRRIDKFVARVSGVAQ